MSDGRGNTLHALLRYRNGRATLIEIDEVHDAIDVPDDLFPPDFTIACQRDAERLEGALRFVRVSERVHDKVVYDQQREENR